MRRVEIKIQNLLGILLPSSSSFDETVGDDEEDDTSQIKGRLPQSATVTFSGSANNMQVRSSLLCTETGLLMVESEPLRKLVPSQACSPGTSSIMDLEVPFYVWKSVDDQPHLVVTDILASDPFNARPSPISKKAFNDWSVDAPDILEITIRVGCEKGVAFMVFSGDDRESSSASTIDLPIRRPAYDRTNNLGTTVFSDQARLCVQVRHVVPFVRHGSGSLPPSITSCSTSSTSTGPGMSRSTSSTSTEPGMSRRSLKYPIVPTRSALEAQIGPLLQKLQRQEQDIWDQHHTQNKDMELLLNAECSRQKPSSMFCAFWNWDNVREIVTACHGSSNIVPDDFACDSSTIGTHASWDL